MATHASARKRARQAERRRLRNRQVKSRLRRLVKTVRAALAAGEPQDRLVTSLRQAEKALRAAASKGIIPKRRASRTVSRLARQVAHASPPSS